MHATEVRVESEVKFLLSHPAEQVAKLLKALGKECLELGVPVSGIQLDRYLDTADWDLHAAGWSYRFREAASGRRSAEMKSLPAPGSACGIQQRQEVELAVEAFPDPLPALCDAPLGEALQSFATNGGALLRELFRVRTERTRYSISDGTTRLALCIDDSVVETGRNDAPADAAPSVRFHELELELEEGDEQTLHRVAWRIGEKLRLLPSGMSKFARGLQAAGLAPPGAGSAAAAEAFDADTPVILLARHHLARQFETLLANEAGALDGGDPECVHEMRVASRRLRVALQVFASCSAPSDCKALLKEVRWITQMLGDVRDLDVFRDAVTRDAAEADVALPGFQAHLLKAWRSARRELVKCLTSARFQRFKLDFARFLHGEFPDDASCVGGRRRKHGEQRAAELAAAVLLPLLRTVRRDGRRISASAPDERLHQLRLKGKRLRYLLELFASVDPDGLKEMLKASKALQAYLGDHQDACVALARINHFRKSRKSGEAERNELKRLRKHVNRRRRQLRAAFPAKWKAFAAKTSRRHRNSLVAPGSETRAREESAGQRVYIVT